MKKLIVIILSILACSAIAEKPSIVAVVNEVAITMYDLNARKKMIAAINNVTALDAVQDKKLSEVALENLIDEELIFQHAKSIKGKITNSEIDNAVATIEERNKMPPGSLRKFLAAKGVNTDTFENNIKSELIKMNVVSQLARSVNVSPKEIDTVIMNDVEYKGQVKLLIFTAQDDCSYKQMINLQAKLARLDNCSHVKDKLYNNFAIKEEFEGDIKLLDNTTKTLVNDLRPNSVSAVFKTNKGFRIIFVCNKSVAPINEKDSELVVNFLTNKKASHASQRFFAMLRQKASIKTFLDR